MIIEARKKLKKVFYPLGIFFLVFIIEVIISTGSVGYYFLDTGKARINDIVSYTKNYSMTMGDAFADVAQLSLEKKDYGTVKNLFQQKIRENTIDEAFFVLNNGTIVVHSNRETSKELRGNLANDEFSYNLDMILMPARKQSRDVIFSDYNIIAKRSPFKRRERKLLEKYLYEDIDSNGWLVTRAVFHKKKAAGAVSFIISKDRVFSFIEKHIVQCRRYLELSLMGSGGFAFFLSLIVFIRYRWIQRKTARHVEARVEAMVFNRREETESEKIEIIRTDAGQPVTGEEVVTIDLGLPPAGNEETVTIELDDLVSIDGSSGLNPMLPAGQKREIKDPIPLSEKEATNDFH